MKNFFKKLSFVLALAMIVTAIAPAAGAFAASAPALSAKGTKYLYLGNETKSSLDLNVTNKPAGASYVWSSSKKTVATVDKYGVVKGVKQGKTTVSLAITKKDGSKTTLSVDFVVRNNIKSFTGIVSADNADIAKLVTGKEYDLNSKFTTNGGSTTSTSSVARWSVDSDKATIDVKTGLFKATEAGTYKVTVNAFETATGADAWVALNDKASTVGVKATGTFEVTVLTSLVSTKQVNKDTVELTFDGDVSKSTLEKDLVFYQLVNDTPITTGAEKIKSVSFDTTGKVAKVVMYAPFTAGSKYKVVAGTFVSTFTAATANVKDLKTIVFDDFNVKDTDTSGVSMLQYVKGLNADGVAILTGAELAAAGTLTFTYGGDNTKGFVSGSTMYLYSENATAAVTVNFIGYVYDDVEKKFVDVKATDSALATYVKVDSSVNNASVSYLLDGTSGNKNSTATGWATSFQLPAGDGLTYIHSRYQTKDASDVTVYSYNDGFFTYTSSDPNKLLVNGQTMLPLAQGEVTVLVKLTSDLTKVVGTFTVQVIPARTLAGATADVGTVTFSNTSVLGAVETKDVIITAKDSMGAVVKDATTTYLAYDSTVDGIDFVSSPGSADLSLLDIVVAPNAADGTFKITFGGEGATPGVYQIKVKVSSVVLNASTYVTLAVVVQDASVATPVAWGVSLDNTTIDLKTATAADVLEHKITASVYGYNAKGARVIKESNAKYSIKVFLDGVEVTTNVTSTVAADEIDVVKLAANTYSYFKTGTYVVQFIAADTTTGKPAGALLGTVQFTVKDTTTTSVDMLKSSVTYDAATLGTVQKALKDAFEVKVNGVALDLGALTIVNIKSGTGSAALNADSGAVAIVAGTTLYIDSFQVKVADTAGTGFRYLTIDVKKTIAIK